MKVSASKILTTAGVALVLGLSGCATSQQLEKVKQHLSEVEATANAASEDARTANDEAAGAMAIAEDAKAAADESAVCCVGTNEKMDRMFEESQRK
jgi:methyl-accepting chemotaxis protein